MTTLIFDWSDWDGPASGHVVVTRRTWRRAPESLHVPWQVVLPVDGRATLDVAHMAGEAVSILWSPRRAASRTDHVLIPDSGEHLAHLLDRVDPSTLEPLPEDLPSAVDLVARAEALVSRIESGEFTGADGDDGRGITSVEMIGATARFTWTDGTTQDVDLSALAGDDGDNGVGVESVTLDGTTLRFSLSDGTTRDVDAAALRGKDGRTPNLAWDGTRLVVDGVPGPDLRGPAGEDGKDGAPGPAPSIKIGTVAAGPTPSATITGTTPEQTLGLVLPKGDRGDRGETGPPGVVSSASSYVIVGPGRPDQPATTAGTITGAEPVGAEYRSQDGAQVGAYVWMKRPGGKWEATVGDTGARNVLGLKTSHWSTNAPAPWTVRRVGNMVLMSLPFTTPANTSKVSVFSDYGALAGFRPPAWTTFVFPAPSGTGTIKYAFSPTSHDAQATASTVFEAVMSWVTAEPWPTTLPGSPT